MREIDHHAKTKVTWYLKNEFRPVAKTFLLKVAHPQGIYLSFYATTNFASTNWLYTASFPPSHARTRQNGGRFCSY